MKRRLRANPTVLLAAILCSPLAVASDDFTRQPEVIYGRKHGVALTLDVFTPKAQANGAAVIWVVSGGWVSSHDAVNPGFPAEFLRRGYTVFAVVHGSQPKYTIPEVLQDIHRSVRFIRARAAEYRIDPNRIGITGASAGGHLSLMQGVAGDAGDPAARDPIDRVSSRVQAVACFFPPTDFLNYGKPGENAIGRGVLEGFPAPFAFENLEKKGYAGLYVPVTDEAKIQEIGKQISPVTHVTADDPPSLILHGDKDVLVPIQQAEILVDKLKAANVPAELVVKKGAAHGWPDSHKDLATFADWFDKHLGKK